MPGSEEQVVLVGNMTRDPELRYTPGGVPVASFGLAVNRRKKGPNGEWEDAPAHFYDVSAWRTLAENVAESFSRGTRLIVVGRLDYRTWETNEGDKRSKIEIVGDYIGPDCTWATVEVTRNEKREGQGDGGGQRGGGGGRPSSNEPPFDYDEEPF